MHFLVAGAVAGLLHVVSGPDHLVAVAPLAMRRPIHGLRVGLSWGLGHASGVLLIGAMGVLLRAFVNIETLSKWAEVLVGFVLVAIGGWALLQMRKVVVHKHPHRHPVDGGAASSHESRAVSKSGEGSHVGAPHNSHAHSTSPIADPAGIHAHLHVHDGSASRKSSTLRVRFGNGAYLVGVIHGAAGTGHLFGVLPSLAMPPAEGALYLLSYGATATFAMGGFGLFVGLLGNRVSTVLLQRLMIGSGIGAILLGLYWIYSGI